MGPGIVGKRLKALVAGDAVSSHIGRNGQLAPGGTAFQVILPDGLVGLGTDEEGAGGGNVGHALIVHPAGAGCALGKGFGDIFHAAVLPQADLEKEQPAAAQFVVHYGEVVASQIGNAGVFAASHGIRNGVVA